MLCGTGPEVRTFAGVDGGGTHMTLRELKAGQSCIVENVGGEGALRQHFLDMGIIPGAEITIVKFAPMGDPVEISIHGYELSLRLDDADKIIGDYLRRNYPYAQEKQIYLIV